ncbi:MAG: pyridoxal phosphate-dependent aminotransferase [Armatimonadetes bacterium]|nr:pyridoxal phosphate-dependent aminotransferase [Armatimonadota bacterium]
MPSISERSKQTPESPIRKLVPFAEAAQKRGTKVYFLNIGQPDLEPPTSFWTALENRGSKMVAYGHSAGLPSLREKAIKAYRERGIVLKANELIITTAGSEGLMFAMMACLNPGDEIIVPEPLYANYIGFAAMTDVNIVPIPTYIEDSFALPGVEEFERRITPRTKAILICNPNNPTGCVYSRKQLEELRDLALAHDLYVFADEVYRQFNYTGEPIPSVLQLEGLEQHAVCVDSVSKTFSLCGARVGFLMSRNAEVMAGALRFAQARLSAPVLEQAGVEGALDADQAYFDEIRVEYMARRDLMLDRLSKIPGVKVPKVDGAFYAMIQLPIDDSDRFCQWMLEEFSHNGATVMTAPGTGFYATEGAGKNEVRIAYVLKREDLDAAMDCLEAGLAAYPGRVELANA